jgi:hypothetical protein
MRRSVEGDTPSPEARRIDFTQAKTFSTDASRLKARQEKERNRVVMNFRPITTRQVNHLIRGVEKRILTNKLDSEFEKDKL